MTFLPEGAVGCDTGISDLCIKKMSDRTFPLQLKHILKSNSFVEKCAPVAKRRAAQTGDDCEVSYVHDYDFKVS